MNLHIAVCDDEYIICEEIKKLLLSIKSDYTIDIFHNGMELLACSKYYDIIFLDIEMPEMDGMKTAESLRQAQHHEMIIFLTSHMEFMQNAFKVKAFRYLNKPIKYKQLQETIFEIEEELLQNEKLPIHIQGVIKLINLKDIICFEAFGDGTYIYTIDEVLETNKPLRHWIDQFGSEHFFQTHRAYYIALRHVRTIEAKQVIMNVLKQPVPISRRQISPFKEAFYNYVTMNAQHL